MDEVSAPKSLWPYFGFFSFHTVVLQKSPRHAGTVGNATPHVPLVSLMDRIGQVPLLDESSEWPGFSWGVPPGMVPRYDQCCLVVLISLLFIWDLEAEADINETD